MSETTTQEVQATEAPAAPAIAKIRVEVDPQLVSQINNLLTTGFELEAAKLVPSAHLMKDLGLDSLDAVDMLVYIEDKFGIKVEGEKLRHMQTLQDIYELAAEAVVAKPSAATKLN